MSIAIRFEISLHEQMCPSKTSNIEQGDSEWSKRPYTSTTHQYECDQQFGVAIEY